MLMKTELSQTEISETFLPLEQLCLPDIFHLKLHYTVSFSHMQTLACVQQYSDDTQISSHIRSSCGMKIITKGKGKPSEHIFKMMQSAGTVVH